jgi:hypothetical protein
MPDPKALEALRTVLLDSPAAAGLATYKFGTSPPVLEPAIFALAELPKDVTFPCIQLTHGGGEAWGALGKRGWHLRVGVSVWGGKSRSGVALRETAWAAWEALDRATLALSGGYRECGVRASPPEEVMDGDGFPGLRLTVVVSGVED